MMSWCQITRIIARNNWNRGQQIRRTIRYIFPGILNLDHGLLTSPGPFEPTHLAVLLAAPHTVQDRSISAPCQQNKQNATPE